MAINSETLNQVSIIDLDVYSRSSQTGGALIHKNDFAISNAIIFYLTSARGDYLYRPELGGVLNELLFKLLTSEKAATYASKIQEALLLEFGGIVRDVAVNIITNFQDRYYEIQVFYISRRTEETNQAVFFTKPKSTENQLIYTDIFFTGDNLLGFVILQLEEGLDKPLLKNQQDGKWYWNLFRFVNFSESSPNFTEIYNLINKST